MHDSMTRTQAVMRPMPSHAGRVMLACCFVAGSILSASARADAPATQPAGHAFPGFSPSRHFGEQIKEYRVEPGVQVHVNAPAREAFDPRKPTTVVVYALPNGNTIAQTIGRQKAPDVDWHFYIQHIGAQTRRLREVLTHENLVIAYVEADGRSWPAWKPKHEDYGAIIHRVVDSITGSLGLARCTLDLSGHSGGGSFVLGYIDGTEHIGPHVQRITFLDSNYGYSDEKKHGDKLIEWLRQKTPHFLSVIAYDDREIMLDGKKVVGPTGGTYRATLRMIDRLKRDLELEESPLGDCTRYRAMDGRLDIILHGNPKNAILHTALVGDMSGFIHVMTSGTPFEGKAGPFAGPIGYEKWIQPD